MPSVLKLHEKHLGTSFAYTFLASVCSTMPNRRLAGGYKHQLVMAAVCRNKEFRYLALFA